MSSSVNLFAGMDTTNIAADDAEQRKRPRFHAACWNFRDTTGVRRMNYFGGSVALGSAGFGVVGLGVVTLGPDFGAAGFAAPVVGGAGTPDCTL